MKMGQREMGNEREIVNAYLEHIEETIFRKGFRQDIIHT